MIIHRYVGRLVASVLMTCGIATSAAEGSTGLYERAAWTAEIPQGAHLVQGRATIVDARTIHVEHFHYDGTAPSVYFYLGETNSDEDFLNGLELQPELESRPYVDETLTIVLPEGESLDGYGAISVWCSEFSVNFSSASFEAPSETYARAGWVADLLAGGHEVDGYATIINERMIFVEDFTYDGLAPSVFFYLGEHDTWVNFFNGLMLLPELDRAYDHESLVLTLPDGSNLDGWGAIAVWCTEFNVLFSSRAFVAPCLEDVSGDGSVNVTDLLVLLGEWGTTCPCSADIDCDGVVNVTDLLALLAAWGDCPSP